MLAPLALLIAIVIFSITSYLAGREVKTPRDMFRTKSVFGSTVSMIIGNVTLGTGLVYYLSLLNEGWLAAALPPFGVFVGYWLLATLIDGVPYDPETEQNFLHRVLLPEGSKFGLMYFFISLLIILTFTFLFALELYISAPIISSSIGIEQSLVDVKGIALGLGGAALIYAIVGGIRGVIYTDVVQVVFLTLMIASLLLIGLNPVLLGDEYSSSLSGLQVSIENTGVALEWDTFLIIGAAFFTAISTQFYNIINVGMGSNFESQQAASQFRRAGIILFFTLLAVVGIGALIPSVDGQTLGIVEVIQVLSSNSNVLPQLVLLVLVFGLAGVLMSTIDSLIILVSEMIYEKFGFNSHSDRAGLLAVRTIIFIGTLIALSLFLLLFETQPKIIPILLTVLLPLTLAGPMIAASMIAKRAGYDTVFIRTQTSFIFILALLVIWLFAFRDTLNAEGNFVTHVGFLGWIAVSLIALVEFAFHKFSKAKEL